MADQRARPEGIAGSPHAGPFPVGAYAAKLRDELRKRARVQLFGEVFGLRVGRARVWFELRDAEGAVPCSMWRDAFEELRLPAGALSDGGQVVVAGGPDYYAGSRTASPSFSFAVSGLRLAGEGDLLAQVEVLRRTLGGRRAVRAPEAPGAARAAALHRRGHRRERQGARRRARRPAPPRLGRAGGVGLRPRAGPPRRPGHHARPAGPGRRRGGRGRRRGPRRRVDGRPLRLLRRDAVPHGGAAARAGHRLGRPPQRPHADRRRRRGELLDADPRRRDRRTAALRRGARRRGRAGGPAGRARAPRRDRARPPPGAPLARAGRARRARAAGAAPDAARGAGQRHPARARRARGHARAGLRPGPPRRSRPPAPSSPRAARRSTASPSRWPPTTPSAWSSAATRSSTTATATC